MNGEPLEICHRESPFGVVFWVFICRQQNKVVQNN